eukprot:TRINITY_DN1675_c0_g1_i1.p1 TRINITY_DN1675_c0_g1~~TRINITY_DN1675_c0_g1_i1.p1  ORF type:complete len:276 (+),score=89.14 TRINITY_DN1675_c0_g1_i1:162-989(+)
MNNNGLKLNIFDFENDFLVLNEDSFVDEPTDLPSASDDQLSFFSFDELSIDFNPPSTSSFRSKSTKSANVNLSTPLSQTKAQPLVSPKKLTQNQLTNLLNNQNRYKTELCYSFMSRGYCPYGDDCLFAHGKHELRNIIKHPKFKTRKCKNYHGPNGYCCYGNRCSYIHDENLQGPPLEVDDMEIAKSSPKKKNFKGSLLQKCLPPTPLPLPKSIAEVQQDHQIYEKKIFPKTSTSTFSNEELELMFFEWERDAKKGAIEEEDESTVDEDELSFEV